MKPKTLYLILCCLGVLVPYAAFVPWLLQHGLDMPLFVRESFANRIGAFFGMDVLVSAIALLVYARIEGARVTIPHRRLVGVAVLAVGCRWHSHYFFCFERSKWNVLPFGLSLEPSKGCLFRFHC